MKSFLLLGVAAVAFAQQPNTQDANYYVPEDDARVGQRLATQLQTNVTATTEPRLDQIGNRLAAHSPQVRYRFFVFDGASHPKTRRRRRRFRQTGAGSDSTRLLR
jgi:hypothetical protein